MLISNPHREGVRIYQGMDWRGTATVPPLGPRDTVLCCDLRDVSLDGLDLSLVYFLGCRLNGATFRGADLRMARFRGCFASPDGRPTNFLGAQWGPTAVLQSHLHALSERFQGGGWRWSPALVAAASDTLSSNNLVRREAAIRLGDLGQPEAAYVTGCLLSDKEWDVRTNALRTLGRLRGGAFPHQDSMMVEWMFLRLGDEHSVVRQEAERLVEEIRPTDELLRTCIARIMAQGEEGRLAGVRAVLQLARFVDWHYAWLVDREAVRTLLADPLPAVRVACLNLLKKRGEPETTPWVVAALADPVPAVRVAAFNALRAGEALVPASTIKPFLTDPDEDVRRVALMAFSEQGTAEPGDLERALSDPSPVVRELAQEIAGRMVGQA